jgi:CheY-like chemotaxis protein
VLIILVADDDDDDCVLVKTSFPEINIEHDLRFVGDGKELLDYLRNEGTFADPEKHPKPSIILLDLNMPRIDGRSAIVTIKSNPELSDIPILVFSTSREERDIELTRKAGASAFLTKPEIFEDLTEMLSKFCAAIQEDPNIPFEVIGR